MMTQQELFPSVTGQVDVRGDVASSKESYLWVVETKHDGTWIPVSEDTYLTRDEARRSARMFRSEDLESRVVVYKACFDSKGRLNRQINSERLDY